VSRPVVPRSVTGAARMPASVLRRRPAEVVPSPAARPAPRERAPQQAPRPIPRQQSRQRSPQPIPQRIPPPPAAPPRRLFQRPRRRPLPAPYPVRGRRVLPLGWLAAGLVFIGLFAVAAGLGAATGFDINDWFRGPDQPPPHAFPVLDPSTPERLTIPSIKVEAPIMRVGRAADGTVAVPPLKRHNEAGWFDQGPTPGQFGPALIVGHADTRTGPAIFKDLDRMKPGAKIEVLRRDNTVAVFKVNSVEHYGKGNLPIQRVYGDYSRPSLRLVTCGGAWIGGKQGYADNIIVFAALVDSKKT
jgi:hypothetical protein